MLAVVSGDAPVADDETVLVGVGIAINVEWKRSICVVQHRIVFSVPYLVTF